MADPKVETPEGNSPGGGSHAATPADASPQFQDGQPSSAALVASSRSSDVDPASASSTGLKRRRLTSDVFAKRKRATTACQFCRLRKTKCDNARPVCGFCQYHKANCVYGDYDPFEGEESYSVKGSGSEKQREIIDRLDEIKELLLQGHRQGHPANSTISGLEEALQLQSRAPTAVGAAVTPATPSTIPVDPDFSSTSASGTPAPLAATRGETLLRWPVLRSIVAGEDRMIESFAVEADADSDRRWSQQRPQPSAIPGDSYIPLCQKFLQHVHPRNPILNGEDLLAYAKHVTEHGLSWDAPSCLVVSFVQANNKSYIGVCLLTDLKLLTCAIASLTQPWRFSPSTSLRDPDLPHAQPNVSDEKDLAAAESYYSAAKKRIGLLGSSIIDMQCFLEASIYEKFCLRPLQAWFYIQQGCSRLQTRLLRRGRALRNADADSGAEARLFWSCIRSEGELAAGTGLRPSGLDEFTYPELFPKPPASLSHTVSLGASCDGRLTDQERSWYFYVAEISVWRMINGTIWLLYRKGESHWLKNIDDILRHYEDSQKQIIMWYGHLPASLKFEEARRPQHELAVYLQGRYHSWRELILRPIIYYALHRPRDQPLRPPVLTLAHEGVGLCSNIIISNLNHHLHGGTWFVLRAIFSASMLILAVVCKARDGGELLPPPQWQKLIKAALAMLEKWGRQAPDVERMRRTLERVSGDVWRRTGLAVSDLLEPDTCLEWEKAYYMAPAWTPPET